MKNLFTFSNKTKFYGHMNVFFVILESCSDNICLKWNAKAIMSDTVRIHCCDVRGNVFLVSILKNFRGNTFDRIMKLSSKSKIVTHAV